MMNLFKMSLNFKLAHIYFFCILKISRTKRIFSEFSTKIKQGVCHFVVAVVG
mgnify:CR=1 FL=1